MQFFPETDKAVTGKTKKQSNALKSEHDITNETREKLQQPI